MESNQQNTQKDTKPQNPRNTKTSGTTKRPQRHKKNLSFGVTSSQNPESDILSILNRQTFRVNTQPKANTGDLENPFLAGKHSKSEFRPKKPNSPGKSDLPQDLLETQNEQGFGREPLLGWEQKHSFPDTRFRKQSLQQQVKSTRHVNTSINTPQKQRKSSRKTSRLSTVFSSYFEQNDDRKLKRKESLTKLNVLKKKESIFGRTNPPKGVQKKILKKVLLTSVVVLCLAITFYAQFFHYRYLTQIELEYLPTFYESVSDVKNHNFGFNIIKFLRSLFFFFPLVAVICALFLPSQSQCHVVLSYFFVYSSLGVFAVILFSNPRPYWQLELPVSDSTLCLRSFGHPDTLLFDSLGFAYYIFTLLRKLKFAAWLRWSVLFTLLLFNFLIFLCLFADGQVFLTQYLLTPGLFLAAIILVRALKKSFESVFEGLNSQRKNSNTTRFYFTICLFLVLILLQNFAAGISSTNRNMDWVTTAMECIAAQNSKQKLQFPNPSLDRIVGVYPLMMSSQGVVALLGMTLGLFLAHFTISDNRFWLKFSKKLFVWRIGLSSLAVVLCIGSL